MKSEELVGNGRIYKKGIKTRISRKKGVKYDKNFRKKTGTDSLINWKKLRREFHEEKIATDSQIKLRKQEIN